LIRLRVPDRFSSEHRPHFERMQSELRELADSHPGFRFQLTGPIVVIGARVQEMISELLKSLFLAAAVIFVTLTLSFRSMKLGLLSLLPNLMPMAMTAALMVVLDWPLVLATVIVFSVCLGVAVDDTVHFLTEYRRLRREGRPPRDAVQRTFVKIGTALFFTTAVLISGFATTFFGELDMMWKFGSLSCVAFASALVGDLFLLPALLLWWDRDDSPPRNEADSPRRSATLSAP